MLRHAAKQLKLLRYLKPFSAAAFAKSCAMYPFDRYFRNGKSSSPLVLGFYVTRRCNSRCLL
ncbi:MAG: hypothetical protein FJ088_08230, partial [Deltaproteobacteria bacterium]|nr:hypothetical protein [Deltaproteobacteria bacterium]